MRPHNLLKRISKLVVLTKRHTNIAQTPLLRGVYVVKTLGYLVEIYTKYFHTFDNRAFSGLSDRYAKEGPIRRKTNVLAVLILQTDKYYLLLSLT